MIISLIVKWFLFIAFILGWPQLFLLSAMAFDNSSETDKAKWPWVIVFVITLYPVAFGWLYYFGGGEFLYVNKMWVAAVCTAVPVIGFLYLYGEMFTKFLFRK